MNEHFNFSNYLLPPIITYPINNSTIDYDNPIIYGVANPNSIVRVEMKDVGVIYVAANCIGLYKAQFQTHLPNGIYTITSNQIDLCSNISKESKITFTINKAINLPPPNIINPPDKSIIENREPLIIGSATPNNIIRVCLSDSLDFGCMETIADKNGDFNIQFNDVLPNDDYIIKANQRDLNGNISQDTISTFTVKIEEPLPPPTIYYPEDNSIIDNNQPTILGFAIPKNTVKVCILGIGCITTAAIENGEFSVQFPETLDNNTYTIVATQMDSKGNISDDIVSNFTVNVVKPLLPPTIDYPPNNSTIDNTQPIIKGTAIPGNIVRVCISNVECINALADEDGFYSVQPPIELPNGTYTITAIQQDLLGNISLPAISTFTVFVQIILPPPIITNPPNNAIIQNRQPIIIGIAQPNNIVRLCLDSYECIETTALLNGTYITQFPELLPEGNFTIKATQINSSGDISPETISNFTIKSIPPPPPTIEIPEDNSTIADPMPYISGLGVPGYTVKVCLDNNCYYEKVNDSEEYNIKISTPLLDDTYTITAIQIDDFNNESLEVSSTFTVSTKNILLEPISTIMGENFRTIEINFNIFSTESSALIYYLLLPPGSKAPTPEEIVNYQNESTLIRGTAARGQFEVAITPSTKKTIWQTLFGKEVPNPIPEEVGIVDGFVYDVYIYAIAGLDTNSGVLIFDKSIMGMPFDGGDGSINNPYEIRDLSDAELNNYPDLLAGNQFNKSGINENARMLSNIERLEVLYDISHGFYGIINSLGLNYLLISSIDLINYASAYNRIGWIPIGNYDASHEGSSLTGRHIFTGTLSGEIDNNTIYNLPITPTYSTNYWVEYIGLIGYAENANINNINIVSVVTNPTVSPDLLNLRSGSLVGFAKNCIIENININNVSMSFNPFGDSNSHIYGGGIVGEFFGGSISNSSVDNIKTQATSVAFNYLGGLIGYAHNEGLHSSIINNSIRNFNFSSTFNSSVYTGCVCGIINALYDMNISNINIIGVDILGTNITAGGAIGFMYIRANVILNNLEVYNTNINSSFNFVTTYTGGVIGGVNVYAVLNMYNIICENINLDCLYSTGGLIGYLDVSSNSNINIYNFDITIANIIASESFAGGIIGIITRDGISSVYIHDGKVHDQVTVVSNHSVGGLIGSTFNNISSLVYIENCDCSASIKIENLTFLEYNTGGFIGYGNYVALYNCNFIGFIYGGADVGGIIGSADGVYVGDCHCSGTISGFRFVGGIVGYFYGENILAPENPPFKIKANVIEFSSMVGDINILADGNEVGGLIGYLRGGTTDQCFSFVNMELTTSFDIGLLIGRTFNSSLNINNVITNCYTDAIVTGRGDYVGGLIGYNQDNSGPRNLIIENCYSSGSITCNNNTYGILSYNVNSNLSIKNCFALNQLISASGDSSNRIANTSTGLQNNYALNTLILVRNNVIVQPISNPNGRDGQTISIDNLQSTMINSGWSESIWNFYSIQTLGRPTLLNNPEN